MREPACPLSAKAFPSSIIPSYPIPNSVLYQLSCILLQKDNTGSAAQALDLCLWNVHQLPGLASQANRKNLMGSIYNIRRPRPSPRQGRRLGPPEVWNLLCHSPLFLRHSSLPFARLQTLKALKTLQIPRTTCHQAPSNAQNPYNPPTAALLPRGSCHQALWPSAFAVPGLQPALCLHIPRGTPSSWPSAFQHCSLPFACTKPSLVRAFKPAVCQASNA